MAALALLVRPAFSAARPRAGGSLHIAARSRADRLEALNRRAAADGGVFAGAVTTRRRPIQSSLLTTSWRGSNPTLRIMRGQAPRSTAPKSVCSGHTWLCTSHSSRPSMARMLPSRVGSARRWPRPATPARSSTDPARGLKRAAHAAPGRHHRSLRQSPGAGQSGRRHSPRGSRWRSRSVRHRPATWPMPSRRARPG